MFEGKKSIPTPSVEEGQGTEDDEQPMQPDAVQAIRDEIEKDLDRKYQLSPDNVAMAEEENSRMAGLLGKMANSRVGKAIFLGAGALTIMAAKGSFSKVEAGELVRPSAERSAGALSGQKDVGQSMKDIGEHIKSLREQGEAEMKREKEEYEAIKNLTKEVRSLAFEISVSLERFQRRGESVGESTRKMITELGDKMPILEKLDASGDITKKTGKGDPEADFALSEGKKILDYAQAVLKFEQDHPKEVKMMETLKEIIKSIEQRERGGAFLDAREKKLLQEAEKELKDIKEMYPVHPYHPRR